MKTLIVGDIHLCTSRNAEDVFLSEWLVELVRKIDADHLVFAGDTFEISFCTQKRQSLPRPDDILQSIMNLHRPFFDALRDASGIRKITFLVGEHDYLLLGKLKHQLESSFSDKEVCVREYFYDKRSKLLAIHGHQLDYNLIPSYLSTDVLTDRLTRVFENFIFQNPEKTESVLRAFERQSFSFWYAAGRLPDYIDATEQIFGHNPDVYFSSLSGLLRSPFLRGWVTELKNPFNRRMGHLARFASILPASVLRRLSRPFWAVAQRVVLHRSLALLKGQVDPTLLNIEENLDVDKLVVGHTHHNGAIRRKYRGVEKAYYCTSAPRWYVRGIKNDFLELHRDEGFVLINEDAGVAYVTKNDVKRIPLPTLNLLSASASCNQNNQTDQSCLQVQ